MNFRGRKRLWARTGLGSTLVFALMAGPTALAYATDVHSTNTVTPGPTVSPVDPTAEPTIPALPVDPEQTPVETPVVVPPPLVVDPPTDGGEAIIPAPETPNVAPLQGRPAPVAPNPVVPESFLPNQPAPAVEVPLDQSVVVEPVEEAPVPDGSQTAAAVPSASNTATPSASAVTVKAQEKPAAAAPTVETVVAAATGTPIGLQASVVLFLVLLGILYFRFLGSRGHPSARTGKS